jgi:hypothetical protein
MEGLSVKDILVFVFLVWVLPLFVYYVLIRQDDDEPNRQ